jgi:hypothetical protein
MLLEMDSKSSSVYPPELPTSSFFTGTLCVDAGAYPIYFFFIYSSIALTDSTSPTPPLPPAPEEALTEISTASFPGQYCMPFLVSLVYLLALALFSSNVSVS